MLFLDAVKNEYLMYLKLAEDKAMKKGAVIVADNVEVSKNEMQDYLEYVRSSGIFRRLTCHRCVTSIKEYTSKIEKLGGKVLVPKTDVPGNIFLSWSNMLVRYIERIRN